MYHVDQWDNSIVIDGFENGIADAPDHGIANLQNINIASVPGEANVGFATISVTSGYGTTTAFTLGTLTSVASNIFAVSGATGLETGMAISLGTNSNFTGLNAGSQCYWVGVTGGSTSVTLYTDPGRNNSVSAGGSGSANFTVFLPAEPKQMTQGNILGATSLNHYMLDANGLLWSDKYTTQVTNSWVFMGNSVKNRGNTNTGNNISGHLVNDQSEGNGLVYFNTGPSSGAGHGYIFVFSSASIDYMTDSSTNTWTYGWNPYQNNSVNNNSGYLTMGLGEVTNTSHYAFVAPDGNMYFCDWWNIVKLFQTDKLTPTEFNPLSKSTYTITSYPLLPFGVYSQCLAPLGVNMLIGGSDRYVYQWDTVSTNITFPIQLPEQNVQQILSVDSNAYIFAGNRGRIYITNGVQAVLYKKVPDHISGTVEPYFQWGGAATNKNQIYFSMFAIANDGVTALNFYGGVWAINLETKAIRLTNQLSYGSYAGFASSILAQTGDPTGYGLFIGWNQSPGTINSRTMNPANAVTGAGNPGIDQTSSNPYTTSVAMVDSDNIPLGTFDKPNNFKRVSYLLTKPLVSGESITLQSRTDFSQSWTTLGVDSTAGNYTFAWPINVQNVKWIQLRAILNSTTSSPSFVRLKQLRMQQ